MTKMLLALACLIIYYIFEVYYGTLRVIVGYYGLVWDIIGYYGRMSQSNMEVPSGVMK